VGLGIAGSAIGTVLAQLASAAALLWVVVRAARREGAPLFPDLPGVWRAAPGCRCCCARPPCARRCW
jgi:Na+-driven multidrug efflux pump